MSIRSKAAALGVATLMVASLGGSALGAAIPNFLTNTIPTTGVATAISPVVVTFNLAADSTGTGNLVLTAPTNFTFGTVANSVTATVVLGTGATLVVTSPITPTATTITIPVTTALGPETTPTTLTISGITAITTTPSAAGPIVMTASGGTLTLAPASINVSYLTTAGSTGTTGNSATPTAPVVRAGGFVGTASYSFTEPAVNTFPAGGFVLTIDISDAQGGRTVHFDKTSSVILSPDSLGLSAAFSASNDYTLIITSTSSSTSQIETLGIGGLKVKADAGAALGAIRTRYSLSTPLFDLGGKTTTSATGRVSGAGGAPMGAGPFDVALDSMSPAFVVTGGSNGPITFTDGANTETINLSAVGAIIAGVQTLTKNAGAFAHAQFTPVSQTQSLMDCSGGPVDPVLPQAFGVCLFSSIGTVVDSVKAAPSAADVADGTVSVLMIQRGLNNGQAFSPITLDERTTGAAGNGTSSGYIAAGATITLTLDPALGVKFSQPPTATAHVTRASSLGTTTALTGGAATVATVTPGANSVADPFGTTVAAAGATIGFSNLYVNDIPTLFENRAVTEGAANVLTPTSVWGHNHIATMAVGQDRIARTDGTALALQSNQAGLTLAHLGMADLSPDRLTATFTVATASAGGAISEIVINGLYDASAASAAAARVTVGITISNDNVVPPSVVNAILNNTASGTADAPTVIIGENNQQSGTVTIMEAGAGALGSSASTNVLRICYVDPPWAISPSGEIFTRAPWAVVTAGDLKLRTPSDPTVAGTPAAPGTGVRGDLSYGGNLHCAQWLVYTASTVASTIEIRGSAADGTMLGAGVAHGPQINVGAQQVPGPSTLSLLFASSFAASGTQFDLVVNAIRVYGGSPIVAAASNPEILRGTINQPAGNVTITETQTYQLGNPTIAIQNILFAIVPNNQRDILPSVYFDTNRNIPVVSTNAATTGLVAHFGGWASNTAFVVTVDQRAFVPITGAWIPGVITVSSIKYNTTTDAAYGNVELQVCSPANESLVAPFPWACGGTVQTGDAENPANISDTITNAHVVNTGLYPILSVAQGYKTRETTPYITYGTEIIKAGTYVTIRVKIGAQFAGKRIEFWYRAGKTGTWVRKTIGRVDSAGYAYWSTRPPKLTGSGFARYNYYRAYFAGTSEVAAVWSQTMARVVVR